MGTADIDQAHKLFRIPQFLNHLNTICIKYGSKFALRNFIRTSSTKGNIALLCDQIIFICNTILILNSRSLLFAVPQLRPCQMRRVS